MDDLHYTRPDRRGNTDDGTSHGIESSGLDHLLGYSFPASPGAWKDFIMCGFHPNSDGVSMNRAMDPPP